MNYRQNNITRAFGVAAISSVVALASPAAVVYTEIPDALLTEGGVPIDLDANGTNDFVFFYSNIDTFGEICNAFPVAGAVGTQGPGGLLTDGLLPSTMIPEVVTWSIEGNFMIWVDTGGFTSGDWAAPGTEKFVALRIAKADGVHFGWARVRNVSGATGIYLRDWAYETSPNTAIKTPRVGDVTVNNVVNVEDLLAVIGQWGACGTSGCTADVDGNGVVNVNDLLVVINHWG